MSRGVTATLGDGSLYAVVRPAIVWDLLRIFPSMLLFYVVTGAGTCGFAFLWYMSLLSGQIWLIPFAASAAGARSTS